MKLTITELETLHETYKNIYKKKFTIIKDYLDAVTPNTNTSEINYKIYNIFLTNTYKITNIIDKAVNETTKLDKPSDIEIFKSEFHKAFQNITEEKNITEENKTTHLSTTPYEQVNHPSHYNKYDVEVIDMMEKIWGKEETAIWCKLTAFKYRMRLGEKPDNPIQQDLNKETWYLQKYNSLKKELNK